jgi:hypothetical protein
MNIHPNSEHHLGHRSVLEDEYPNHGMDEPNPSTDERELPIPVDPPLEVTVEDTQ